MPAVGSSFIEWTIERESFLPLFKPFHQSCVTSSWLFSVFMDVALREMRVRKGDCSVIFT